MIPGKSEISNEPMSESAATWASGSEECKPESEGRHHGHPHLVRERETSTGTRSCNGMRRQASIRNVLNGEG